MTKEQILAMPEAEYMNPQQLAFFEALLRDRLASALHSIDVARARLADLGVAADDLDKASIEEERQGIARSLDRLNAQVRSIRGALERIADGEYGWCESTGEPIGLPRLLAQPEARLSAIAQTQAELVSKHYAAA